MRFIELTVKQAYFKLDKRVANVKSAFIGLCTDIDRFFTLHFGFKMNEKINKKMLSKVCNLFPNLSGLSCEQFNRILVLFSNIRGVNAHLSKNTQIIIDEDLVKYFVSIAEPKYLIRNENKLTLYGCFYLLSFLSCKYQIWTFVTSFLRPEVLDEEERDNFNAKQQELEKYHQEICGNGKPIFNETQTHGNQEIQYLNEKCKTALTNIFFSIEKVFMKSRYTSFHCPSFKNMLNNIHELDDDIKKNINNLRNYWLHGKLLNDVIIDGNKTFKFDLNLIIDTLALLKNKIQINSIYKDIICDIDEFGQSLFNFYILRLIEVSHKILDVRLLTCEKLDERINNSLNALKNFQKIDYDFYKKLSSIMDRTIYHKITKEKFTDKTMRIVNIKQIKIIYLHSDNGFQIGDFYTKLTDLALTDSYISLEHQNKINGKYLSEYQFQNNIEISPHIMYCESTL